MTETLGQLQIASRFSLWMWAMYWPGGGLLLLAAGMTDPASIFVALASVAGFVLVLAARGVPATASRNMREFMRERPLYIIGGAVLLALVASFIDPLQNVFLALFSGLYVASILATARRLVQHTNALGQGLFESRGDQVLIALLLGAIPATVIFLDAFLPLVGGSATPAVSSSVATMNWMSLLYPPILLLAMRPFREPLRNPFRRRTPTERETAPEPVTVTLQTAR